MLILAARPGNGKTSLAMQWAMHVASKNKKVFFASIEMKNREVVARALGPRAQVSGRQMRDIDLDDVELDRIDQAAATFRETPMRLWDKPNAQIGQLTAVVRQEAATVGVDALFIDHIGKIKPSKGKSYYSRHDEVSDYATEIKSLARELDIPVICLCQLNREADKVVPTMSNLRESGKIEEEADQIMFIHNPETDGRRDGIEVSFIIPKNRHGQKCQLKVFWNPSTTSFTTEREWTGY